MDLHITKADKLNAVVILNKDYLDQLYALLEDRSTYSPLRTDPTETVRSKLIRKQKSCLKIMMY